MLKALLRRFVPIHQRQIYPLLVAIVAGALGVRIGVRACYALAPADTVFDFAALVVLFKLSKFCFAPRAIVGLRRATQPWERVGHLALLALVLALMAGSIGPSYVFTTHNEAQVIAATEATRARSIAESDEYAALTKDIDTYDEQIAALLKRSKLLLDANKPTKAGEDDEKLRAARAEKEAAVKRRTALGASVLPVAASGNGINRWVHLAAAVALELVGVAASVLVHTGRPVTPGAPTAQNAGSGGGTVVPIGATRKREAAKPSAAGYPAVGERFTDCLEQARSLIQSGEMKPTLDALACTLHVSQRPAKRILEALRIEGVIRWTGHRYERCITVPPPMALAA